MEKSTTEKRLVSVYDLMNYTSVGRNKARELGELAGAVIKIGKRTVYDIRRINDYLGIEER